MHIFVYGTLRHAARTRLGEAERRQMRWRARLVCRGAVRGIVRDLGGYPGMSLVGDATRLVHGEIWRVLDARRLMPMLDAYEETACPDPVYVRSEVEVRVLEPRPGQGVVLCWVYCLPAA